MSVKKAAQRARHSLWSFCFLVGIAVFPYMAVELAKSAPASGKAATGQADVGVDGQHDFDWEIGIWKTHIKRLQHPLSGSTTWVEYEGTYAVRKVWNGRANLAELEADGSLGHIEALSLRLYNPQAHQWSLTYANPVPGSLGVPAIGEFKNGRGEFFDYEPINGRSVLVRQVWSNTATDSPRFEQAFSEDGGKTWEVNWITVDTRMKD